jgi:hypothetical protein
MVSLSRFRATFPSLFTECLAWVCVWMVAMATGIGYWRLGCVVDWMVRWADGAGRWASMHTAEYWPASTGALPRWTNYLSHALDWNFKTLNTEASRIVVVAIPVTTVVILTRIAWPPLSLGRSRVRTAFMLLLLATCALWIPWMALATAMESYWDWGNHHRWDPKMARLVTPMVDTKWLGGPTWGALLGVQLCVIACARWAAGHQLRCCEGESTPHGRQPGQNEWTRCVRCGYEASAERPCPECGLENPLALRRVYFGRWHARLMLSRWRWAAVLPWVAVVVLFFWPLISGLARHWLG